MTAQQWEGPTTRCGVAGQGTAPWPCAGYSVNKMNSSVITHRLLCQNHFLIKSRSANLTSYGV